MASLAAAVSRVVTDSHSVYSAAWVLGDADDGIPIEFPDHSDRSVQVAGTFGGATVNIEGSNDGVNYVIMHDPQGAALNFNTAGLKQILEISKFLRCTLTGGSAVDVTVTVVMLNASNR